MRRVLLFVLLSCFLCAEDLPITGISHVGFKVSNLEKARSFYTGVLGYEEAFALKDAAGKTTLAFFKVNDDQYIEISPSLKPDDADRFTHLAFVTTDLDKLRRMLAERGFQPGEKKTGRDGN